MPRYFPPKLRRRLAPVFLVIGLLLFGKMAYQEVPQEQRVRFVLTPAQQQNIRAVRVTYTEDEEVLLGWEQRFSGVAPPELVDTPSLRPGHYRISIELIAQNGQMTRLDRGLDVPAFAAPQISLGDLP